MDRKLGLGIGLAVLVLLPSIGLAQKQQTDRERTDRQEARRVRALAKIVGSAMATRNVTTPKLAVDVEGDAYLAVTVTDGQGEEKVLEFEANEKGDGLRPVLPKGTEAEIFGREYFGFGFDAMLAYHASKLEGNPPKEELLPFDAAAAQQEHDDVSVFVVDEDLVLIRLWHHGQLLGTYYAVNMDAAVQRFEADQDAGVDFGDGGGDVARGPGRDAVCRKLGEWCTRNTYDMPTLAACVAWLLLCDGGV